MIKSIRLQNFFGFQDCTINLEKGENVLVGINGSGKSNFFKAIKFLKEAIEGKALKNLVYNEWGAPDNVFFSGKKGKIVPTLFRILFVFDGDIINSNPKNIQVQLIKKVKLIKYEISIGLGKPNAPLVHEIITLSTDDGVDRIVFSNSDGVTSQLIGYDFNDPKPEMAQIKVTDRAETAFNVTNQIPVILDRLRTYIRGVSLYSFFDTSRGSEIRKPVVPLNQYRLIEDGSNLAQLLNWLKQNQKIAFSKINEQLEKVSNVYTRVDFSPLGTHIQLQLDEKHLNRLTPALNVSDGTLKFLCLMSILYNPRRGKVICIDEPELGLHPDMINTLYRAIEHAAETSQIIISTHSAHLLDYFKLENLRVFEKDENNATEVEQFSEEDFKGWYKQFNPGQMWRAGDIGGKRW